ncbi:MAG: DUF5455 family protein [Proteobacteria bacterium]|nr:DUF5455 family protein [Pseudomonadota bacterium]
MPLLATLLTNLFGALAGWLAQFVGKKLAVALSAVATLGALTATFYGAMSALLNGVAAQIPDMPGAQIGMWVACPANLPACYAAILSCDTTVALYRWSMKNLGYIVQST